MFGFLSRSTVGLSRSIGGLSTSSFVNPTSETTQKTKTPPGGFTFSVTKYKIIKNCQCGRYLLIQIKYDDCTNFEGEKIALYKDCTLQELMDQKSIDPHFSCHPHYHSPVARFEPTLEWWKKAIGFMYMLED